MIEVYSKNNTAFDKNGDMALTPESCTLSAELNGTWKLEMTHSKDSEGRWMYLEEEVVIAAPTFMGSHQLFRIDDIDKSDTDITLTAYPIFYDSADDCFLMDIRPESKNGQQALDIMMAGSAYSGESDILTVSTAYFVRRNLMDAINGDDSPTFIQRWGGEVLFDNRKIIINGRAGGNYGVEVRYGKNIDGINYMVNMSSVVTRIVPVAYNGYMMSGASPWVDSSNISTYAKIYTKEIRFEDVKMADDEQEGDVENGVIICHTQQELNAALTQRCNEQYALGIDLPSVTIDINMVDLSKTEEYKDYKILETVGIGDTLKCIHRDMEIETDARVIKLTWDCIQNHASDITLGDFEYDFFDNIASTVNRIDTAIRPDGTVVAEKIKGIIDGMTAKLRAMKDVAQKQDVRAVLFEDLDPDSPTFGAMALGTAGFEIADKRTTDGRDWAWSTFGTAQGFYATYIIAGLMSSQNWIKDTQGFQLDLDHGTINSKNLKLDTAGVLRIYQAVIEGGSFTVNYTSGGIQTPMFVVNGNGVGIGPGGQLLTYYAGDSFMTLASELRILSGRLTGYANNGQKGIEMDGTRLDFYSWNDAGNYVGTIRSFRKSNSNRIGIEMLCDTGDLLGLGVADGPTGTGTQILQIDGSSVNNPVAVNTGMTVSGAVALNGGVSQIAGTISANIPYVKSVSSGGVATTGRLIFNNGLLKEIQ